MIPLSPGASPPRARSVSYSRQFSIPTSDDSVKGGQNELLKHSLRLKMPYRYPCVCVCVNMYCS